MNDRELVQVVPHPRQLAHQQLEFYGFIHFTVNTFTDKEWGDGTEKEEIFNPVHFDAEQWARILKDAGMKGLILTCKHHDGFCLWPSRYTAHTVANSPYRDGKGDIVREVSDACRKYGLKFGIYLSPWDRNQPTYGSGTPYNDYFIQQLKELLTGYGEIFSVWFDGACGEGKNGKVQTYDWTRYESVIRDLQPGACISVCGSDVRWCGNEAGDTRPSEWSVVPLRTRDTERIKEKSQQTDDASFRERKITAMDLDLGSREVMKDEKEAIWYPAEVNTSIRPGWFYHESEDNKVRSLEELKRIYYGSVGGNGMFLLNIPPNRDGLIHREDEKRLHEFGTWLRDSFSSNRMDEAKLTAAAKSSVEGEHSSNQDINAVRCDNYDTWYQTDDGITECMIDIRWEKLQEINHIVMKENISLSQRIERFRIEVCRSEETEHQPAVWETISEGTVVGYKKIIPLNHLQADHIRIHITDARVSVSLAFVGIY